MGLGCDGDGEAGETFEVLGQIEAAVEAPFVAREVSWCVADVDRAARAGDGALHIGEPCVGPFEIVPGRSSTTGDLDHVLQAGLVEAEIGRASCRERVL